jgi:N utilization substance protein B
MSSRHTARSLIMQTLYQWDFRGKPTAAIPAIIDQLMAVEDTDVSDNAEYIANTVQAILQHIETIDQTISVYAPKWPLEIMTIVDRNILRLGVYEMTLNDSIPAKVAINEAIEIAKEFGGPASGKFVNGILGAMYTDMKQQLEP